jgi:predicted GNAT family acetyltransferase
MANVHHTESGSKGRFSIEEDGRQQGELTYSRAGQTLVILDHTAVSSEARGTGTGRALVDAAVAWARETGIKLMPLCPYARSVFEKDPSIADVWHK